MRCKGDGRGPIRVKSPSGAGFHFLCLEVLIAACVATSEDPLSINEAVKQWNFAGYQGSVDERTSGLAWVHAVVTLGRSSSAGNVAFAVDWTFGETWEPPQATIEYVGIPMRGVGGGMPSESGGCAYPPNVGSSPRCGDHPSWSTGFTSRQIAHYSDLADRFGIDRPVLNWLAVALNHSSVQPVRVHGTWKNVMVNWSVGTANDTFLFYLKDFHGAAPKQPGNTTEELSLELENRNASSLFVFNFQVPREGLASRSISSVSNPYFVRPNGTSQTVAGKLVSEYSNQTGDWRFVIPQGINLTEEAFEAPAIWGAWVKPAEFSWAKD